VFAPIQIIDIWTAEFYCTANPDYPGEGNIYPTLEVRQNEIDSPVEEVSEEERIPLVLNLETTYGPSPREEETDEDEKLVRVSLYVGMNEREDDYSDSLYRISLSLFSDLVASDIPQDEDEKEIDNIIRANTASILYGYARRMVKSQTDSSIYRPILLPSVNFENIVRHEEEIEKEEEVEE
jgi:preprotein translocase subunit SecB